VGEVANDRSGSLTPYLTGVGDVALLSAEQEVDLAKRAAAGRAAIAQLDAGSVAVDRGPALLAVAADGRRASDLLVRANLRLVVSMAARSQGRGLDLPDLVQEGNLGLLKAVDRFDHRLGYRFSTYAAWWIRQAIGRGVADRGRTIRLPIHAHETMVRLRRVELELWQELDRAPSDEELARRLGVSVTRLRDVRGPGLTSLDAAVGGGAGTSIAALVADPQASDPELDAVDADLRRRLHHALDRLDPTERQVVELRYGLRDGEVWTFERIGHRIGTTRDRARQLERRAIRRLLATDVAALADGQPA
jgi:RNA polymerase primary sigma factor